MEADNMKDKATEKQAAQERRSFEQLMEEFYQRPFTEIDVRIQSEELCWGAPVGEEV